MKLAIMQPYFLPYIGYFQLMKAVDEFVVYDNIEFTKKGWINRNRILINGTDAFITLPLRKDSDFLNIGDRFLAEIWPKEKQKMLNRMVESYRKAPHFKETIEVFEECISIETISLFDFLLHTLMTVTRHLGIATPLVKSTSIDMDHSLRSEDKVIAMCCARKANIYLNPIGGVDLYSKARFQEEGIDLLFLKANPIRYPQFSNEFVPSLSIVDVMMFNPKDRISEFLDQYTLS